MKNKLPYIIASIVLLLILGCGFVFGHMPMAKQLQEKRVEYTNKQNQLKLVREKIQALNKLKDEYESIKEQASVLAEKIPQDPNVPDIVSLMGKFALESGITVSKVEFENNSEPVQANGEAANSDGVAGNSNNDIDIRKCTLTLNGKYESMLRFFNEIKSSPRLFGIEKITITQDEQDGRTLKLDLKLAYFNYKSSANNQTTAP
jgi:Tfp pilus assembly protein PilO